MNEYAELIKELREGASNSRDIGIPAETWLSWLKSPVEPGEVENG